MPTTQTVREKTTTTLMLPLTDSAGDDIVQAGLTTLTATLTSNDTGTAIFAARNVLSSLSAGVLSLVLTSADNARVTTTKRIEVRTLVLSATYDGGKVWHSEEIPIHLVDLTGIS